MIIELLISLTIIWLIIATVSDIKIREIPNWLSFSLIIIAISFQLILSIINKDPKIIIESLTGFGIFFLLGNLMYYTNQWGGGDAKILMGIGAIFPKYPKELLSIFNPRLGMPFLVIILFNILLIGAIYSLTAGIVLAIKNKNKFKQEFNKKIKNKKIKLIKKRIIIFSILSYLPFYFLLKTPIIPLIFALMPIFIFYLWFIMSIIEKISMYKKLNTTQLREGDWIINKIKKENKILYTPKIAGVTNKEIKNLIKNKIKKVTIRDGLPFLPAILLAVIISLIFGNIIFYII
jgi:Flp pilus assembly protein protease CpaA